MTCERCNGTGKLAYTEEHLPVHTEMGGERVVIEQTTRGTRACPCVRDLPPVEGEARWWDTEVAWERVLTIGPWGEPVEMSVDAEVPRREDGRRVVLRGNRYFPTTVDVLFPAEAKFLSSDDVRLLAAALNEAADAADAIDAPCADLCGHWWPCDCVANAIGRVLAPVAGVPFVDAREAQWERLKAKSVAGLTPNQESNPSRASTERKKG